MQNPLRHRPLLFLAVALVGCHETPTPRSPRDAAQANGDFDASPARHDSKTAIDVPPLPNGDTFKPPRETWARGLGGRGYDVVFDAVMDKTRNLILAGTFSGTWHLPAGDLHAKAAEDVFVTKIDAAGKVLWVATAGGSFDDEAYAVSASDDNSVFVTGHHRGESTFGATTIKATKTNAFIAKLDGSGSFLWAKTLGGDNLAQGRGVASDGTGGAYVIGRYEGTAHFGTHSLTASPAGKSHGFLARVNTKGDVLWASDLGAPGEVSCDDIIVSKKGPVLSGWFTQSINIAGTTLTSQGKTDGFVTQLDPSGKMLWATAIARGADSGWGGKLALSGDKVVVAGSFQASASFDKTTLTSQGGVNFYLTTLDASGKVLWASSAGGDGSALAFSVTTGSAGAIFIGGTFSKPTSIGGKSLVVHKGGDAFVAKFSSDGKALWATSGGGDDRDAAYGIAVDSTEKKLYALGNFAGNATFAGDTLQGEGNQDIFIWKLDLP